MDTHRLAQWALEVWRWLADAKLPFMGIFVILAAVLVSFVGGRSENAIVGAGYALQLMGMIFAVKGLLSLREHFKKPLLRYLFLEWVKRFPKWRRSVVTDGSPASLRMSGPSGSVEIWNPDDPEKPVARRLDEIIKNLERIRANQSKQARLLYELEKGFKEHEIRVSEENRRTKEEFQSELESLFTNDLITSLVGLLWVAAGMTMSTWATQLSGLVHSY